MQNNQMKDRYSIEEFDSLFQANTTPTPAAIPAAQQQGDTYGAFFPASPNDTPLKAGLKSAGNYASSLTNFLKMGFGAVYNFDDTAKGMFELSRQGGAALRDKTAQGIDAVTGTQVGSTALGAGSVSTDMLQGVGQQMNERYGTSFGPEKFSGDRMLRNLQQTATNDPFGFGAEVLGGLYTGAAATGQVSRLNKAVDTVGGAVTSPITKGLSGLSRKITKSANFGVSQMTGLSPDTVSTIVNNTDDFARAQAAGTTRTDLADDIITAVNIVGDEVSDLGKAYDPVRTSGATVSLPDGWLQGALDKYGLKLKQSARPAIVNGAPDLTQPIKWEVIADRTSRTRNATDINKLQEFVNNWGDARTLTADEYLNMRHDLAELAKYDMSGKSTVVRQFGQQVREGVLNADDVRNQIPGLKNLDAQYADDITFYKKLKKDFLDARGNIKDGAASKVVNAINASNPERLARLEAIYPGFTKQAKVIKALEDVENAMGLKVGSYARGAAIGGQAIMGNIPGAVITAIITQPEIAVPLLKGYGYTAKNVAPVLRAIRDAANDINNFRVPGAINQYIQEKYPGGVPVGLSTKAIHSDDIKFFKDYLNAKNPSAKLRNRLYETFDAYGMKVPPTDAKLKDFLRMMTDNSDMRVIDDALAKSNPFNKSATTKTTDLLEEARTMKTEGKTFDEFVKAQGTTVYHGSDVEIREFSKSFGGETTGNNKLGTVFLTTDKTLAKQYGIQATLAKNSNVSLNTPEGMRLEAYAQKQAKLNQATVSLKNPKIIDLKGKTLDVNKSLSEQLKALDEGHDGIIYKNAIDDVRFNPDKKPTDIYAVFDPSIIKTRAQLEDIWKQANGVAD